jgi:putative resolvase
MYASRMKLSEWAARNGVHYQTAWRWARDGKMPVSVTRSPTGLWLVHEPDSAPAARTVAYCRVSSADQKADLDWTGRWPGWCRGLPARACRWPRW